MCRGGTARGGNRGWSQNPSLPLQSPGNMDQTRNLLSITTE